MNSAGTVGLSVPSRTTCSSAGGKLFDEKRLHTLAEVAFRLGNQSEPTARQCVKVRTGLRGRKRQHPVGGHVCQALD